MRCPNCRKDNTIRPWEGKIQRLGVDMTATGRRCSACGETLFDAAEAERQEQVLVAGLVERGGRTGSEFALVRKAAGLRGVEVAELFGVRPETVSRWEHGETDIPRTAAFAIGELFRHPKLTRQSLAALAALATG
jgi:putative zinc finger/helix-turn-helix YgiT family protein